MSAEEPKEKEEAAPVPESIMEYFNEVWPKFQVFVSQNQELISDPVTRGVFVKLIEERTPTAALHLLSASLTEPRMRAMEDFCKVTPEVFQKAQIFAQIFVGVVQQLRVSQ